MDMRSSNLGTQRGAGNWSKAGARFPTNAQEFLYRQQRKEWLFRMSPSQKANATAREATKNPVVLETEQLLAEKEMHAKEKSNRPDPLLRGYPLPSEEEMHMNEKSNRPAYSENWLTASTVLGLDNPFHPVRENLQHFLMLQAKAETGSETGSAGPPDYGSEQRKVFVEEKGVSTWKTGVRLPLVASFILLVAVVWWGLVAGIWWIFHGNFQNEVREVAREASQSQAPAVTGRGIKSAGMVVANATQNKGVVEVPLEEVKKHGLVSFAYKGADGSVPLLAYVTPSGNVVTAVGVSEPCNSTSFHIEANELVCDVCGTHWDLDTLSGTSGDCAANPMSILPHAVDRGRLTVKEAAIQDWKPRVLGG